jgi:Xaa-Pro aminopeptidase
MATDDRPLFEPTDDASGYPLEHDVPREEYELRLQRARAELIAHNIDALVVTSASVGQWFTSLLEPHAWHDQVQARSAWFILTQDRDCLYTTPTNNTHFSSVRRSVWVSEIRPIVERAPWPRTEIWDIAQIADAFRELGLERARLGFELGDNMTLGIPVNDFFRLRELVPGAAFVDAGPAVRRLMSIHTPLEIERLRLACVAGVWIHEQVPLVLRPGLTERQFVGLLAARFREQYGEGYAYQPAGNWDVRNPTTGDSSRYHAAITERVFKAGDQLMRGSSGASYRGYAADIDRICYIGQPPQIVLDWYRAAWECNRAMAEALQPGARCSDVYAAFARVERQHGLPESRSGRCGHGLRNTGGLSVHPDNHTVLEPGMVLSVEPMLNNEHGYYDLEDQYLVTETGRECLHAPASEQLPIIGQ